MRQASLTYAHCGPPTSTRTTSCAYNNTCKSVQRRFDVQKLRSQKISESFPIRLSELLHDAPPDSDVNTQWQHIAHSLHTAAGEKVKYRRQQKSTWFDDECRQAAIERNDAYQATLKLQLMLFTRITARRGEKDATCFAGRSMDLKRLSTRKLRCIAVGMMLGNSFR